MSDKTRTFVIDAYTKLELVPSGSVNVFADMENASPTNGEQKALVNYDARLSVMDLTVFTMSNAADANLPIARVALMFMHHFCQERETGLSATQRKWFSTGTARRVLQGLSGLEKLREN